MYVMVSLYLLNISCLFQVLAMYDRLDAIDIEAVVRYVVSLQQEDGSFFGRLLLVFFYGILSKLACKCNKKGVTSAGEFGVLTSGVLTHSVKQCKRTPIYCESMLSLWLSRPIHPVVWLSTAK